MSFPILNDEYEFFGSCVIAHLCLMSLLKSSLKIHTPDLRLEMVCMASDLSKILLLSLIFSI